MTPKGITLDSSYLSLNLYENNREPTELSKVNTLWSENISTDLSSKICQFNEKSKEAPSLFEPQNFKFQKELPIESGIQFPADQNNIQSKFRVHNQNYLNKQPQISHEILNGCIQLNQHNNISNKNSTYKTENLITPKPSSTSFYFNTDKLEINSQPILSQNQILDHLYNYSDTETVLNENLKSNFEFVCKNTNSFLPEQQLTRQNHIVSKESQPVTNFEKELDHSQINERLKTSTSIELEKFIENSDISRIMEQEEYLSALKIRKSPIHSMTEIYDKTKLNNRENFSLNTTKNSSIPKKNSLLQKSFAETQKPLLKSFLHQSTHVQNKITQKRSMESLNSFKTAQIEINKQQKSGGKNLNAINYLKNFSNAGFKPSKQTALSTKFKNTFTENNSNKLTHNIPPVDKGSLTHYCHKELINGSNIYGSKDLSTNNLNDAKNENFPSDIRNFVQIQRKSHINLSRKNQLDSYNICDKRFRPY